MTRNPQFDILGDMRLSGRKPSSFTRAWTQRPRLVLHALIGFNLASFVAKLLLEAYQPGFVRDNLGLSQNGIDNAYAWQFFTAIFLHAGPWHLLANISALYLLGRDVECILGQRDFLFLYLLGAVAGELGHLFFFPHSAILFGASGGTVAVLMAYATILPDLEFVSTWIFGKHLQIKAKHFGFGALFLGVLLLMVKREGVLTHSVYLGGCAAGWLYARQLGFGRASIVQRTRHQRRRNADRILQMDARQFMVEEVDPLLEKISREGLQSLNRAERQTLERAREKLEEKS
ncbi:MAG: rhomboid family intramembrane serine protease [Chthoniobacterales bacterium]